MTIRPQVLQKLTPHIQAKVAVAFGIGGQAVARWVKDNRINGPLTRALAIKVIQEELDLCVDEILEIETELIKDGGVK